MQIKLRLKYIYKNSTYVVLLSEAFRKKYLRIIGKKFSDKIIVIANPIKMKHSKITQYYQMIANKEDIVLSVGRLTRGKQVDLLLNIWSELNELRKGWKLFIVGSGPEAVNLLKLSEKLKIDDIYFYDAQDPERFYKKAKVFCLLSKYEGLPLVILEALKYGVIPIAYDNYGSVSNIIINNYNGFIVNDCSINFKQSLCNTIQNYKRFNPILENMYSSLNKYDINIIGKKWQEVLSRELNNNKHNQ